MQRNGETDMPTTLEHSLRYIDITFECVTRAKRIVDRIEGHQTFQPYGYDLPTPRGKRIGAIAARLRVKQAAREGIAA
jgi:hypothetical protein